MIGTAKTPRPPIYWVYLYSTAWTGFILIAVSLYGMFSTAIDYRWVVLTAMAVLVATRTLRIPGINSKLSIADIFVLTNIILFGPAAGCVSAALEGFIGSLRCATKARRLEYVMFNTGNVAICAFLSGLTCSMVQGMRLNPQPATAFTGSFSAALVLALTYHLLNSVTVSMMLSVESHKGVYGIWKENFLWLVVNYLTCAFGAALLSHSGETVTPALLATVGIVVIVVYGSYRAVLGKLAACPRG
jgi:hypothetical protein